MRPQKADSAKTSPREESVLSLLRKEHLTKAEAEKILSSIDKKQFLEQLLGQLRYKQLLTDEEIKKIFLAEAAENIPLSVIANDELSALESICRYLKDEKGLKNIEIARLLNRDQRTIWVTYANSIKKRPARLEAGESAYTLPLSIFQDRSFSVLEAVVRYLKDTHNLRYSEIAKLINRDERNVWGLYNRAGKKLKAS